MDSLGGGGYVPLGAVAVAASMKTGDYLQFFNPGPMSSWSSRFLRSDDAGLGLNGVQGQLLCRIIYCAILHERFASRPSLIGPLIESAVGGAPGPESLSELRAIASALGVVDTALREDIVYASSLAAGDRYLFAQEEHVEPLLVELLSYMRSASSSSYGFHYLSCLLLQLLSIHPMVDGNGRLARHLVVRVAGREKMLGTAALVIGLQWFNRTWFNQLALDSRASGLDCFLEAYERAFRTACNRVRYSESMTKILDSQITRSEKMERDDGVVINRLLATGEMDLDQIKQWLSCSSGKARDVRARVASRLGLGCDQESKLSAAKVFEEVRGLLVL